MVLPPHHAPGTTVLPPCLTSDCGRIRNGCGNGDPRAGSKQVAKRSGTTCVEGKRHWPSVATVAPRRPPSRSSITVERAVPNNGSIGHQRAHAIRSSSPSAVKNRTRRCPMAHWRRRFSMEKGRAVVHACCGKDEAGADGPFRGYAKLAVPGFSGTHRARPQGVQECSVSFQSIISIGSTFTPQHHSIHDGYYHPRLYTFSFSLFAQFHWWKTLRAAGRTRPAGSTDHHAGPFDALAVAAEDAAREAAGLIPAFTFATSECRAG